MRGGTVAAIAPARRRRRIMRRGSLLGLALAAATTTVALACHITAITVSGDCFQPSVSGALTVLDSSSGSYASLEVYATQNGSTWTDTGAGTRITLTSASSYSYTIAGIPARYLAAPYTGLRVEGGVFTSGGRFVSGPVDSTAHAACSPPPVIPEAPLAVGLPIVGLLLLGGGYVLAVRRRAGAARA